VSERRSDARERALLLLYEVDTRDCSTAEALERQVVPPDPFTVDLVETVESRRAEVDDLIEQHARDWTVERMPVIDRAVLRLAVSELLTMPEKPVAVVIDEAIELVKRFSTDDSGRFVNGVLAAVAERVR
jgi:transcription antitermination protein NusB